MSTQVLDQLCAQLLAVLEDDPQGKQVASILARFARQKASWRDWVTFSGQHYTRNLVHRCDEFELLLLGWEAGQASPIHDHAGQRCWMAVLEGRMEEVHYAESGVAAPEPGRVRLLQAGQVAYIEDDIALHVIRPVAGERCISLHLYAAPIDACRTFCPETGAPTHTAVGYHSVRGVPCTGEPADAVRSRFAPGL